MATVATSRVGERGSVVLPAELRRRFGMEEGCLVITEAREDGILIRPVSLPGGETYTPERKAEFLLGNATNAEEYAAAVKEVRAMGLDPDTVDHFKPRGV